MCINFMVKKLFNIINVLYTVYNGSKVLNFGRNPKIG